MQRNRAKAHIGNPLLTFIREPDIFDGAGVFYSIQTIEAPQLEVKQHVLAMLDHHIKLFKFKIL